MSELVRVEGRDVEGVRVVQVDGEVDLSNAAEVMEAIATVVPNNASLVVVDLSATAYLDSSGIAMLFRLAQRLGYRRQEMRLVVPEHSPIRAVLELTKVHQVIPVLESLTDIPGPS